MITREAEMKNYVLNTYLKMKIPMGWRRDFLNIANNTQYIKNFCINPYNIFQSFCHAWYLYKFRGNDTIDYENVFNR